MTELKRLRKLHGISQCQLAEAIGVTQGAVSQWERGDARPTVENLISISKFLGCKLDDLIKEA